MADFLRAGTGVDPTEGDRDSLVAENMHGSGTIRSVASKADSTIGGIMKKAVRSFAAAALAVPVLIGALGIPAQASSTQPQALSALAVPSSYTPAMKAKITKSVSALRAKNTWLGAAKSAIKYTGYWGGAIRMFKGGAIVFNPVKSTSYTLRPPAMALYWRQGGNDGGLGYPTSNQIGGFKAGGTVQHFMRGEVYSSAKTGTYRVWNYYEWMKNGGPDGRLGYPTSGYLPVPRTSTSWGGDVQKFRGGAIYMDYHGPTQYSTVRVVINK